MNGWVLASLAMAACMGAAAGAEVTIPPSSARKGQVDPPCHNSDFCMKSEHFTIYHDGSKEELPPLVDRLEATYDAVLEFCRALKLDVRTDSNALRVVVFDRLEDFQRRVEQASLSPDTVMGLHDVEADTLYLSAQCLTPDLLTLDGELSRLRRELAQSSSTSPVASGHDTTLQLEALTAKRDSLVEMIQRMVVQHEAAHLVLSHARLNALADGGPRWLSEGLACLFEISLPHADATCPPINAPRLTDLCESIPRNVHEPSVPGKKSAVPLSELMTRDELFATGDPDLPLRYAQAWSLVHFLACNRREELVQLLHSTPPPNAGSSPLSMRLRWWDAQLGPLDDRFEAEWRDYVASLCQTSTADSR